MTRQEFVSRILCAPLLADGSTGAELSRRGMPAGVCPEQWILEHPDVFLALEREYVDAGTQLLLMPVFGANRIKLEGSGLGGSVADINARLAALTRSVAGNGVLAAADLGPTGRFIAPLGDLSFDEAIDIYREQVRALLSAGPDLFVLETFMDLSEMRAAILAIRDECDLPIVAGMTFEGGRTLTGVTPEAAALAMTAAGADVVGANCSSGPAEMGAVIAAMRSVAGVPLFAKPNAGVPRLEGGATVFPMGPEEFAAGFAGILQAGVHIVGGCCGAGPDHIRALRAALDGYAAPSVSHRPACVSSSRQVVMLSPGMPLTPVGERINPTGKPALRRSLREGDYSVALNLAQEQKQAGAPILDVNCGTGETDEAAALTGAIEQLSTMTPLPLAIDTSDPSAMEAALRRYPGRALMNAVTARPESMERLLALSVRYGATPILLPIGDGLPPAKAEERMTMLDTMLGVAARFGLSPADVVVDGMVMAAASDPSVAPEAVRFVGMCRERGLITVAGVSNVSFGLPGRPILNRTYLAMLAAAGLNLAIVNPCDADIMDTLAAANLLTGRDEWGLGYIRAMKK
ncbi:MAG: homocysteine S-methyltransferase family protein [Christensenellales bacterium]|jgi:5-methyltetrahydrofolate--homocysteine methyltransferase